MTRKILAALALMAMPTVLAAAPVAPDAAALHARLITIDSHVDLPNDDPGAVLVPDKTQFDLTQASRGGLDAAALALFAPQEEATPANEAAAKALLEAKYRVVERLADGAVLARAPDDVRRAAADGKFAVIASVLNADPIGDLAGVDVWAKRGVAVVGFVHAGHNRFADSSRPALLRGEKPAQWGGLSPLGRQAVTRLNDLGTLIDVSQLSAPAFDEVLRRTRAPVIASHSSAAALVPHARNLSDAQLDAIKRNGGVVQINAFSAYLRPDSPTTAAAIAALQREFGITAGSGVVLPPDQRASYTKRYYAIRAREPKATVGDFVDHIDHAVQRIGIDHVGISSDFNHGGGVLGWQNAGESVNVTAELLRRGYSEADIAKLWGENFLRVWSAAKAASKH